MNYLLHIKRVVIAIIYIVLIFIIAVTILTMIGVNDYSVVQNENAKKFGVSFMTMNNPFFEVINDSIKTTIEANGDIVITRDPALDSERQIIQIEDMIKEGVDGLFVCPVDFDKIIPALKEAKAMIKENIMLATAAQYPFYCLEKSIQYVLSVIY